MTEKHEYVMTEEDHADLVKASQPVAAIALNCGDPSSPKEKVNNVWRELGKRMGFNYLTARPVAGKPDTFFTAEVTHEHLQAQKRQSGR